MHNQRKNKKLMMLTSFLMSLVILVTCTIYSFAGADWIPTGFVYNGLKVYRCFAENEYENDDYVFFGEDKIGVFGPVDTEIKELNVPAEIDGNSVVSIGEYEGEGNFLYFCNNLEKITLPDSIEKIGTMEWGLGSIFQNTAFYKNEENWVDGVLYIGNHLVAAKKDISGEYKVREGTKTIADNAFIGCKSLESIVLPEGLRNIGESAFASCSSLRNITIPKTVESIGSGAFAGTAYDADMSNYTDGVLYIGDCLIDVNENISLNGEYKIKDGTRLIADYALGGQAVSTLIIPDSVEIIGRDAFRYCDSLSNVKMSNNVIEIGADAFTDCFSLKSITLPESLKNIESCAFGYTIYDGHHRIEGITINGYSNTLAEEYAKANKISFTAMNSAGDINGDGKVSAMDARWALQFTAGTKTLTPEEIAAADMNGDGKVSAVDARAILKITAGN